MDTIDEMIRQLENDGAADFLDPKSLLYALKKLKVLAPDWNP